jgi:hypothetical protein
LPKTGAINVFRMDKSKAAIRLQKRTAYTGWEISIPMYIK